MYFLKIASHSSNYAHYFYCDKKLVCHFQLYKKTIDLISARSQTLNTHTNAYTQSQKARTSE